MGKETIWENETFLRLMYRVATLSPTKSLEKDLDYYSFRVKVSKYNRRFKSIGRGFILGIILLLIVGILSLLINNYNDTVVGVLGVLLAIFGVFVGAYVQSLHEFATAPEKDVLQPLNTKVLFEQFNSVLKEFSEIITTQLYNGKNVDLTGSGNEFYALLSSPILVGWDDAKKIIDGVNSVNKYEEYMGKILSENSNSKVDKKVICLNINPIGSDEVAPLKRFIKVFSGFMVTDITFNDPKHPAKYDSNDDVQQGKLYKNINSLRVALLAKAKKIIATNNSDKNPHLIHFTERDDIQWQVIAIRIPSIPYYKAVVGFFGEDHLRKNSVLDLLNETKTDLPNKTESYGFITDDPDVVERVIEGLIRPYESKCSGCMKAYTDHHTKKVSQDIELGWPTPDEGQKILCDNLNKLNAVPVKINKSEENIVIDIDYPKFNNTNEIISLKYCQYLFHPIRAESATWTSINIRMPVENNDNVKVLDMCCGIGVQGVVSLFKKASFVHGVDYDIFSLCCAALNYKKAIDALEVCKEGNNYHKHIAITFANCFGNDRKGFSFNEFDMAIDFMLEHIDTVALPSELKEKLQVDKSIWEPKFNEQVNYKKQLKELYNNNKDFIKGIYKQEICSDYDLIILEPPFVEFAEEKEIPSHASLYDKHFKTMRTLLEQAPTFLKKYDEDKNIKEYETPYIMQSFSSLEDIDEFESYLENKGYRIVRKNVLQKNNNQPNDWKIENRRYWYCYHLIHHTPEAKKVR